MSATEARQESDQLPVCKSLKIQRLEKVAEILLSGPGPGNAMGPDFWSEFPWTVAALDADRQVRAIIIRGDGKHFTYGLDLPAMMPPLASLANCWLPSGRSCCS